MTDILINFLCPCTELLHYFFCVLSFMLLHTCIYTLYLSFIYLTLMARDLRFRYHIMFEKSESYTKQTNFHRSDFLQIFWQRFTEKIRICLLRCFPFPQNNEYFAVVKGKASYKHTSIKRMRHIINWKNRVILLKTALSFYSFKNQMYI